MLGVQATCESELCSMCHPTLHLDVHIIHVPLQLVYQPLEFDVMAGRGGGGEKKNSWYQRIAFFFGGTPGGGGLRKKIRAKIFSGPQNLKCP